MKLVLGIIGAPLAGKETCANLFEKLLKDDGYSVSRHTFSDILRETLALWNIEPNRENLQKMAIVMNADSGFGDGSLSRAMKHHIANDTADVTILDGVRWLGDETMIRSLNDEGIKTIFIYIYATPEIRYARLSQRNRDGENTTSWEDFVRQGEAQTEVDIPDIGSRAEIILNNNYEDVNDFRKDIERVYENLFDVAS
jgi:dephospho-CoA kinase